MSVYNVTSKTFDSEFRKRKGLILLDFWASWCGPCRMLSPIISDIAEEDQTLTIGKINVDDEPELAQEFGIQSIPTLIVMRDGEVLETSVGFIPKGEILDLLERNS